MLRQTLLYMPAQLLGPLAMFVAAVVWTHLLDTSTYGAVSYVLAMQELIYMPTIAWWSLFALRYRASADDERRGRLTASDNAVVFGGAAIQVLATMPLLAFIGVEPTPGLMAASAVLFVTRSLLSHYCEIARTEEAIGTYTVAQLAGPLAGTLASFAGVTLFGASTTAALAGIAAAQTLGLAWTMFRLRIRPRVRLPDRAIVREALLYGGAIILASLCGWVSTNGIRSVVEHIGGTEALGLISVGWGLGLRVSSVAAMLLTAAAFPIAVRLYESGDETGALHQLSLNGAMLFGLLAPTTVGVTMVARPLVDLMIAEPFRAATIAVLPLAVLAGAVRNQRTHHFDQIFLLREKTRLFIPLNLLEAGATVVGALIGMRLGGDGISALVGATLGCLSGTAIGAIVTAVVAIVSLGLRPMWGAWARILLACAAMAGVLAAVTWPETIPGLAAEIAVGASVYALSIVVLFPEIARLIRAKFLLRVS
ncbi:MAG: lipopolysaccharide biosynthesis protein [Siculibacillus sp.]